MLNARKMFSVGHLAKFIERATFLILGAAFYHVLVLSPPTRDARVPSVKILDFQDSQRRQILGRDVQNEIQDQTVHLNKRLELSGDEHSAGIDESLDRGMSSKEKEMTENNPKLKTILFWNNFFQQESYGLGTFGQGPFIRGGCRINTCQTTNDKSLLDKVDSVIIHGGYGINQKDGPLPVRQNLNQIFVFFEFEPPLLKRFSFSNMNDMMNLTFTYLDHPDTDIYAPYGIIKPKNHQNRNYVPIKPPSIEKLRKKTKQVAWMVSDCNPASKRMEYAKELSKYINVDIYGRCGLDICPRGYKNCTDLIENNYKFYLAFENSLCDDYITEKTFKMMFQHNLIPIVLGKANYTQHVPPHSVIDVRDFESPFHLADFLLRLDRNDELYLEYFQWKKKMAVQTSPRIDGFCRLCEILHDEDYIFKKNFKVDEYWNADKSCVKGDAELKMIHLSL